MSWLLFESWFCVVLQLYHPIRDLNSLTEEIIIMTWGHFPSYVKMDGDRCICLPWSLSSLRCKGQSFISLGSSAHYNWLMELTRTTRTLLHCYRVVILTFWKPSKVCIRSWLINNELQAYRKNTFSPLHQNKSRYLEERWKKSYTTLLHLLEDTNFTVPEA